MAESDLTPPPPLLIGQPVYDARAERIGLFNRVVASDALGGEALALAKTIAAGPSFAHGMTKKMLDYEQSVDFATGIEAEAQAHAMPLTRSVLSVGPSSGDRVARDV